MITTSPLERRRDIQVPDGHHPYHSLQTTFCLGSLRTGARPSRGFRSSLAKVAGTRHRRRRHPANISTQLAQVSNKTNTLPNNRRAWQKGCRCRTQRNLTPSSQKKNGEETKNEMNGVKERLVQYVKQIWRTKASYAGTPLHLVRHGTATNRCIARTP